MHCQRCHGVAVLVDARRNGWRESLACLCARSKEISLRWRTAGRHSGPLPRAPAVDTAWPLAPHSPSVSLTPAQAVALLAAVSAAPDAPYSDLASAGIRKIMDVLDPRTRAQADELARRIWVNTDQPGTRAVRSALEEAMSE